MTPEETRLAWIREILELHSAEVARFRAGEERLIHFFMGELMRRSQGRANPVKGLTQLREALIQSPQ
jgi:Asp-tRNA(Asn)/Glu-tRNA(Gln) amidotransferase B subunit